MKLDTNKRKDNYYKWNYVFGFFFLSSRNENESNLKTWIKEKKTKENMTLK